MLVFTFDVETLEVEECCAQTAGLNDLCEVVAIVSKYAATNREKFFMFCRDGRVTHIGRVIDDVFIVRSTDPRDDILTYGLEGE